MPHHLGAELTDAGRLDDDEVVAGRLADVHRLARVRRQAERRGPGGQRAHVDPRARGGVHPDAVAQKRAPGAAFGGVHRDDRDPAVRGAGQVAPHQLVHQRRLARAARARDAQHGHPPARRHLRHRLHRFVRARIAVLGRRDQARHRARVAPPERAHLPLRILERRSHRVARALQHLVDHPLEPHRPPVVGREDPVDAAPVQLLGLRGQNGPAAAAEDADVRAPLAQQVAHVGEELHVTALVRADRDGLRVLLDRALHDLEGGAVVPQVDDFRARILEDPAHHVDGGVVPVEERRRRDYADGLSGARRGGGKAIHPASFTERSPGAPTARHPPAPRPCATDARRRRPRNVRVRRTARQKRGPGGARPPSRPHACPSRPD